MKKALLIGIPNVGKSTIFSRLTDKKVKINTVPGTAVEVKRGSLRVEGQGIEIIDIPGVNNLFFNADQEKVARNILIEETPDLVIQVADAKNLKRSLVLTSLLADMGLPLVLVLNMVDEAAQKGIKVKRHKLEEILGAPVIETVASEGIGIPALLSALDKAVPPSYPSKLPSGLADAVGLLPKFMTDQVRPEWVKRALALFSISADKEIGPWAQQRSGINDQQKALDLINEAGLPFHRTIDLAILRANDLWAEALYEESVYFSPITSSPLLNRIGDLALTPITGLLILFTLLAALYFIVGKFAAGFLVDFLVKDVFGDLLGVHLKNAVDLIPFTWLRELIVGEYGLYPMALVPAFGLVLPVIVVFFFTFGFIEDSGYFSRLSILLDRLFRKIGLNGKAVMPLILGFSCVTMATISTRILDSKRERFIAIFLLSLGVPCSAKLSIILVIMARISLSAFLLVFGVVFALTALSGFILSRLMPGKPTPFIMEIPLIRIPSLTNVLTKTSYRSMMFIREALPLFIISALGLFLLEKIGLLALVERISAPVIKGFLGLPPQFAESLIMGFLRGEAGIAVLKKLVDTGFMDHLQLVVAIIVTILFIPCITSFMLIIKEQGMKQALTIVLSVTACAIVTGGLMNTFLRWINVSF